MDKKIARSLARNQRESLTKAKRQAAAIEVAEQLVGFMQVVRLSSWNRRLCVHCYLPIPGSAELDTTPLFKKLSDDWPHITWVVPWLEQGDEQMKAAMYHPGKTELTAGPMQVPQPAKPDFYNPADIDIVLLPMLCHDAKLNRVGYGKGYYDRFLAACSPEVLKLGLGYFDALPELLAADPWDVSLDEVFTAGLKLS